MNDAQEQEFQEANNFKVNKWMRSLGFKWRLDPGTPEKPSSIRIGAWYRYGVEVPQLQANAMYKAVKAKWWKVWL